MLNSLEEVRLPADIRDVVSGVLAPLWIFFRAVFKQSYNNQEVMRL